MKLQFVSLLTFLNVINFSVAFVPWAPIPITGARSQSRVPDSMTNAERLIRELPPRAPKGLFNRLKPRTPTTSQTVCKRGSNGNGNGNDNGNGNSNGNGGKVVAVKMKTRLVSKIWGSSTSNSGKLFPSDILLMP
ncbi:uncharacterized protein C8R40DRAFT_1121287 [Lentinula edodes]|uniref:uncharacterized protein n=1 Tax=Lentinula edodes TaxID=5353 RepID=UPI001E8D5D30|nr:uncharacterized protein C8R40DRAFT_1121287 [Lentinula edodes]KAH7871614.1 hypothetical protein C8R40DRAFT_1121287 [Lentinula edodes]